MTLPDLIGVCGRKRSGKDTLGQHLVETFGFTRLAFADKLKDSAYALNPWVCLDNSIPALGVYRLQEIVDGDGWEHAKTYDEVRRLLQALGNEVGQGILGKNVWIDLVMAQVDAKKPVVITDVRYPHEADAIREVGGKVIRVVRPGLDTSDQHASETSVDLCTVDYEVCNDATIAEYLAAAVEVLVYGA